MAFWSFDTGGGGGGGPHPDKAAHDLLNIDSDTLDGFDAADFVRFVQHTKAIHDALGLDAATLDGIDSTGFADTAHNHDAAYVNEADHSTALHDALGINADLVDGLHAAAFALAGHGHAGGEAPTIVVKEFDESVGSSNAFQADDELKFAVGAGETWVYNLTVFYSAASGGDFKCRPAGPAGCAIKLGRIGLDPADTAQPALVYSDIATEAVGGPGGAGFGAGVQVYQSLDAIIVNGATPGDCTFEWTQVTSNATDTVVHALSYLIAFRIA